MSSLGKYFSRFFRRAKVLRYRPYCTHNAMIDDRLVGDNLDDDGDCSVCKLLDPAYDLTQTIKYKA